MRDPQFKIKAPTTTDDDGSPSSSCLKDADRVFRLIEDERHLCALSLYENLKERLARPIDIPTGGKLQRLRRSGSTKIRLEKNKEMQEANELLEGKEAILKDLEVSVIEKRKVTCKRVPVPVQVPDRSSSCALL
jgi:hypothetical protein